MVIKDRIVSWFIQNIILLKVEQISIPGFITIMTTGKEKVNIRELFLPENLLMELEKKIVKNYVRNGKFYLYSIGKKFGYAYSILSTFPTIKDDKKDFLSFVYFLVRWVEATYAKLISYKVNYKNKIFKMIMNDYIICRKNGLGYILTSGGVAGIWSYMACDQTVEGVQTKCQGRGDRECELICAPAEILKKKKLKFFKETDLENLELDPNYKSINDIRQTQFAKHSLKDLIDSGFFSYSQGIVQYKNERHFLCEASLMYILENELKKLKGAEKILFEVSFNYGKNLIKRGQEETKECVMSPRITENFVTDYMSALGWGDILVLKKSGKYSVVSNYFPWTKWAKDIKFIMFRGIISGLLSEISNKKIILKKFQTDFSKGYISLFVSE